MDKKQQFSLWYFLAAFVLILMLQETLFAPHTETLAYSDFTRLLAEGKISEVAISDQSITGTLKNEGLEALLPRDTLEKLKTFGKGDHRFSTVRVEDPKLIDALQAAQVRFAGRVESRFVSQLLSWIVPAVVLVVVWTFLMKRMGGGAHGMLEVGKSKAKVYMEKQTGVTFADVAGIDEAKDELIEVVEFLKQPERYRRLGGKIPKGVLIVGAPGTGKTLLAKAVAGEASVPFFSISGSDFVEMFVGVGAARVRDLFEQAEAKAPCIIFIDELDALGKARGVSGLAGNDEREQTLNQLLVEMDGFDTNKGVIILAATNRPEILDPALLRPGRFDRHVVIDRPDLKGREQILRVHARNVKLAPEVDLGVVAARTPGFAGADLANLMNEAALRAAKRNKAAVEPIDFDEAIDRIVTGLERKGRVMNPEEKKVIAYHEAGHALVAESRKTVDRVNKVSIIPRGVLALGYTQQMPTEDRYLLRRSELLDRIDVLLGGRASEEMVFGDASTGAQNDLQRATDMARHMVMHYGMSAQLGLATFEAPRAAPFLDMAVMRERHEFSEHTAQLIDEEVRKILADAYQRVKDTLLARREALDAIAHLLLEREVLDRSALDTLLNGVAQRMPAQKDKALEPAVSQFLTSPDAAKR